MVGDGDLGGGSEDEQPTPHVAFPGLLLVLDGTDDLAKHQRGHVQQDVVEKAKEGGKSKGTAKGLEKDGQCACAHLSSLLLLLLLLGARLVVLQEDAEDVGDVKFPGDGRQVLEAKWLFVALEKGGGHPSESDPRGKRLLVLRWVGEGPVGEPLELSSR